MSAHEFIDTMRRHGLTPPDYIQPGQMCRFPGVNKKHGNTAAWAKLFPDGRGGVYGDWSTGLGGTWTDGGRWPSGRAGRAIFKRQAVIARREEAAEREAKHAEASARAQSVWDSADPAPADHPYLVRKRIQPHGARIKGTRLVLPVGDIGTDQMTSIQYIDTDGGKMLLSGGRKNGCCIPVAWLDDPARVIIAEGFATAATLAEGHATSAALAEEEPDAVVLAAIDAGNLEAVALAARRLWPIAKIVIAGDDDRMTPGNPGRTKANAAARAAGALVAFPKWPPDAPQHLTDFNDLKAWLDGQGGEA